ncbi:MAG: helix-turn-helix domain-containing protein [Hyphomicrobiales bacterium]|nr:helix-turn-helix domain-containing protein [Hyphomicrobiales bacterium]MCP4997770.1 helix-turn-helix domain-containing protein [Hyphomicrobiales bacterium]
MSARTLPEDLIVHNAFGETLKQWRNQRRLSQLDLGLAANVSARHISFLETGRSQPSRMMVRLLCDSLDLPFTARNSFLTAAGFAPAYRRRHLEDDDMAHIRAAVDWALDRHNPFPAMALDKHWSIVRANASAGFLLMGAGLSEGDSLLEAMLDKDKLGGVLENWLEVMAPVAVRLRTESAHLGGDPVLDEAVQRLTRQLGSRLGSHDGPLPAIVPARYRAGETVLSLLSTIAQFGSAEDIVLAELKIEMMFPADETTRNLLLGMSGQSH